MRRNRGGDVLGSLLLAAGAAELGARILTPRDAPPKAAPVDVRGYFSDEEIARGRRFARPQRRLGMARAVVDLAALVAIVRRPPRLLERLDARPVVAGTVAGGGLATVLSLPSLPLAAVARQRAINVGLATQSWRDWGLDLLKATGIQSAMAGIAGGAVAGVIRRYGRWWWAPASAGSVVVATGLTTLAPVVLDPVFNDFTPLPEGETRSDVLDLARAAEVRVGEVYSVDASRRTTAANAYVTGLGPTKRVVLFDTLLDRYDRDEIRMVVAHELAHVRNRDLWRGIGYAALVAPPAALAIQRLSWVLSPAREGAGALAPLALSAALVSAPIGLLGNRLSRALERRADAFSLELARAPEAFVSFERTIAVQNVADLDPPGWVSKLLATHPPTAERIGMAVAYEDAAEATASPTGNGSAPTTSRNGAGSPD